MKKKIYKIEIYQKDKGWEVTLMFYGQGNSKICCFSTTKQMMKFLTKITS